MIRVPENIIRTTLAVIAFVCFGVNAYAAEDILAQDRRPLADGLMARSLYRLALPEYEALAAQQPEPKELDVILYRLAECQYQVKDYKAAIDTCKRFIQRFPSSGELLKVQLTYALSLDAVGNKKDAAPIYEAIAANSAASYQLRLKAYYFAGEAHFREGDYKTAMSRFEALTSLASGKNLDASLRDLCGFAKLYMADITSRDKTAAAVNSALAIYSELERGQLSPRISAEAFFKSATLLYTSGKYKESRERYNALLARFPDDIRVVDAILPAAWANSKLADHTKALELAERLLRENKNPLYLAEATYLKAISLKALGRDEDALSVYSTMIAKYPGSKLIPMAKYDRIVLLAKLNKSEVLLQEAANFKDPPPEAVPHILWLQAEAAERLGKGDLASTCYARIALDYADNPYAPTAVYRRAVYQAKVGSPAQAVIWYDKLCEKYPTHTLAPYAVYHKAQAMIALNKTDEAIAQFDKVISAYPNHQLAKDALFQKGVSQYKFGDAVGAIASLDSFIAKYPNDKLSYQARLQRSRIAYEQKDYATVKRILVALCADKSEQAKQYIHEAEFLLGITYEAEGNVAEAAKCFQPLLHSDMQDAIPPARLVWLTEFQYSQTNYNEAVVAAEALLKRKISEEVRQGANLILGRSQLALSNTNLAVIAFRSAADSKVQTTATTESALRLGEILLPNNDGLDDAIKYFIIAIKTAAGDEGASIRARGYYGMAQAYERKGNITEALRNYQAVALLFDDDDIVPKALAKSIELLNATGHKDEAAQLQRELSDRYKSKEAQ